MATIIGIGIALGIHSLPISNNAVIRIIAGLACGG